MRNHNISFKAIGMLACFLFFGCATTNAPSRWLSEPGEAALEPYGGWVDVRAGQGHIAGELISVTEDTVFVADSMLHALASKDILSARLVTYDAGSMGGWVFVGTLSTLSNGLFLVFTAPMWLIGGTIAASCRSYDPIVDYPDQPLGRFTRFARYPQGIPSGLDRGMMKMKAARHGKW